jgi:hypothetical protein
MRIFKPVFIVTLASTLLQAEDFSLTLNGVGPVNVHSELTYDGSGERLVATVKNDSGRTIPYLDLCVKAGTYTCLFEMSNKDNLDPGATLRFNAMIAQRLPNLTHSVTLEALTAQAGTERSNPVAPPVLSSPTATSQRSGLTNDEILKLVKAGLSEDVIVGMVNSQSGDYAVDPNSVIAMKQAGVSDRIIAAIIGKSNGPTATSGLSLVVPNARPISSEPFVLHDGTPLRLRLARNLSSADAKTGETIDFEVLDDVQVDDVLLVKRGAVANGTVTDSEPKKRMARGGKLDITIDYVRLVNGDKVALRGSKDTKGGGHTGAMTGAIVATALVVWPAAPFFLFMHGKDTVIPKDTEITAYVNGEIKLDRAKFALK